MAHSCWLHYWAPSENDPRSFRRRARSPLWRPDGCLAQIGPNLYRGLNKSFNKQQIETNEHAAVKAKKSRGVRWRLSLSLYEELSRETCNGILTFNTASREIYGQHSSNEIRRHGWRRLDGVYQLQIIGLRAEKSRISVFEGGPLVSPEIYRIPVSGRDNVFQLQSSVACVTFLGLSLTRG